MDVSAWSFQIAQGVASATMSRGSFRHRDRISRKRSLAVSKLRETPQGWAFDLYDPTTGTTAPATWTITQDAVSGGTLHTLELDLAPFACNRLWVNLPSTPDEHFYGCGETFSQLDLKGNMARIWVSEHQNTLIIVDKIIRERLLGLDPKRFPPFERYESYYVQPTFTSSKRYFVHVEGHAYAQVDFSNPKQTSILLRGMRENAPVRVHYGEAPSFEALSQLLSSIVGIQPPVPEALIPGMILARQGGTQAVQDAIDSCQQAGIPLLGIWSQDWCGCRKTPFGYQVMWNWQWDRELYPDLPQRIAAWKAAGVGFYGYINPFMAVEGPLYKQASAAGYCVKNAKGEDYMVTITTFPAAMIDFTNPAAYDWYKDVIKREMIDIGMDGWMADFGEYLPTDAVLFSGEDGMDKHNDWPVIWARLNQEAIDEAGRTGELFFWVRAGHTGSIPCTPMIWNGDQHVDWSRDQGIRTVIPASLSLAMSGVGVCHSDVGGYTSIAHMKRSRELLARWAELCCFSPLMRSHEGNRPDVNVQFDCDPEMLHHFANLGRLRELLAPYLRAQLRQYADKGTPVMRPLFYHYKGDGFFDITDEYLLGRDILVAPILRPGAQSRTCVLPNDEWVHLFSGETYLGGTYEVEAPLGRPPVFVRKASEFAALLVPGTNEMEVEGKEA